MVGKVKSGEVLKVMIEFGDQNQRVNGCVVEQWDSIHT
jgi:hypothetical protein